MKYGHFGWLFAVCGCSLFLIQCSTCKEPPPGKELPGTSVQDGSVELEWETVKLGISKEEFQKGVAALFLEEQGAIKDFFSCGAQHSVGVIIPLQNAVQERIDSKGLMQYCTISADAAASSRRLVSIRGVFVDKKLASIQFKFRKVSYESISLQLASRFGQGESRQLVTDTIIGKNKSEYVLRKLKGQIWGLERGKQDVTLHVQNTAVLHKLRVPSKEPKADLSDIGLSGSPYDVNLDDIHVPEVLLESDSEPMDTSTDADSSTSTSTSENVISQQR